MKCDPLGSIPYATRARISADARLVSEPHTHNRRINSDYQHSRLRDREVLTETVWTTLNSYATTYANSQASIDVRMRNLDKLAEELACLTRTVESIKAELAAQAKIRDSARSGTGKY